MTDRDLTDLGLTDYQPLYAAEVARRKAAALKASRKIPRPRKPADEHVPAPRPDLHIARIYRSMGWQRDDRIKRRCATCLQLAGQPCVTDTGRRMNGFHPSR